GGGINTGLCSIRVQQQVVDGGIDSSVRASVGSGPLTGPTLGTAGQYLLPPRLLRRGPPPLLIRKNLPSVTKVCTSGGVESTVCCVPLPSTGVTEEVRG